MTIDFRRIHELRITVKDEIVAAANKVGSVTRYNVPTIMTIKPTPFNQICYGSGYYTRKRLLSASWALLAMFLVGIRSASVSTASPSDEPGPGQCTFLLGTPQVIRISGVSFASATVRPGACTMHASPNFSSVCMSLKGEDSPGLCASTSGTDPAVVYHAYRPGATYTVTGQGCASTFAPPYTVCQNIGPSQATL